MSQRERFAQEIFRVSRILEDLPSLVKLLEISNNGTLRLEELEKIGYLVSSIDDDMCYGLAARPMVIRSIWIISQSNKNQGIKLSQIYLHQIDKYLEVGVSGSSVSSDDDYPPLPDFAKEILVLLAAQISQELGEPLFMKNDGNEKSIEGSYFCLFSGSSSFIYAWKYFSYTLFLFANQEVSSFSISIQLATTSSLNAF